MSNKIIMALSGLLIFAISTLIVLVIAFSKADQLNEEPENLDYIAKLNMTVGDEVFELYIENNETAQDFASRLPLTLDMKDLNGNEKYAYFEKGFQTNPKRSGTIEMGDFMLFSSDTLALFYETFESSYSYTRLGKVQNPQRLKSILGSGDVRVTFSIAN